MCLALSLFPLALAGTSGTASCRFSSALLGSSSFARLALPRTRGVMGRPTTRTPFPSFSQSDSGPFSPI
jgi:hypothetical protein